jgi:anthranilate synthase component 1
MTDKKEKSEHMMLVDLARNEMGLLCETGSVKETDIMTLEKCGPLYHMVTGVNGKLKSNLSSIDALQITLPAGTLSGSPKLEAMKMIDQYEESCRGFYGGAVGYVSFDTVQCNTGIIIRSVYVLDGIAHLRSGGGIVARSKPKRELMEAIAKMQYPLLTIRGDRI